MCCWICAFSFFAQSSPSHTWFKHSEIYILYAAPLLTHVTASPYCLTFNTFCTGKFHISCDCWIIRSCLVRVTWNALLCARETDLRSPQVDLGFSEVVRKRTKQLSKSEIVHKAAALLVVRQVSKIAPHEQQACCQGGFLLEIRYNFGLSTENWKQTACSWSSHATRRAAWISWTYYGALEWSWPHCGEWPPVTMLSPPQVVCRSPLICGRGHWSSHLWALWHHSRNRAKARELIYCSLLFRFINVNVS